MPRRQKPFEITSEQKMRMMQRRMTVMRQWIATERAAMELLDVAEVKLADARARIRKRRRSAKLQAAFDYSDKKSEENLIKILTS